MGSRCRVSRALRELVAVAVFLAIFLFGAYVLGIRPSLSEALLVGVCCAVSLAISGR